MFFDVIVIMILFVILFLAVELKFLTENKAYKDFFIACVFLFIALIYGIDYSLDIKALPNPNKLLTVVKPASEALDKYFQING